MKFPKCGLAALGFAAAFGVADSQADISVPPQLLVAQEEARDEVAIDGLDQLREQLSSLRQTMNETRRTVDLLADQRDDARHEVARSHDQLKRALGELDEVHARLRAARREAAEWKERAQAAELTHHDLLRMRGELQGAIAEFAALKGDFAEARSELDAPLERVRLRKSIREAEREHGRLRDEIAMAMQAKRESTTACRKLETEVGELKRMTGKQEEKLRELTRERDEAARKLVDMQNAGVPREKMREVLEKLRTATGKLKDSELDRRELLQAREHLRIRLAETEAELQQTREDLKKAQEDLAKRPAVEVASALEETKAALARVESELGFVHKSKGQLERRIVEQDAEIRDLREKMNQPEEGARADQTQRDESQVSGESAIPRAVIVYEG